MPSVAACDAAGARSAAAHAASRVVLIRIHAPGEVIGEERRWSPERRRGIGVSAPGSGCGGLAGRWCGYPAWGSAERGHAPAVVLDAHELDRVLRRVLAGRGGAHLGLGALLVVGDR